MEFFPNLLDFFLMSRSPQKNVRKWKHFKEELEKPFNKHVSPSQVSVFHCFPSWCSFRSRFSEHGKHLTDTWRAMMVRFNSTGAKISSRSLFSLKTATFVAWSHVWSKKNPPAIHSAGSLSFTTQCRNHWPSAEDLLGSLMVLWTMFLLLKMLLTGSCQVGCPRFYRWNLEWLSCRLDGSWPLICRWIHLFRGDISEVKSLSRQKKKTNADN